MMTPDLRLLATFLSVVDHGSMAEAAATLGYVPSAVSQHVASLERSTGVELLARKPGRRVVATAAGRSLAEAARSLFVAVTTYQDLVGRISESEVIEIRIGAFPSAMSHLLPSVLAGLAADQSGVRVHVVELETPRGLPMVQNGEVDLLLAYRYLPEDPPAPGDGWSVTSLGQEPMILFGGGSGPLTLEQCADLDWVAGYAGNADHRLLQRWTHGFGIVPQVPFETADLHASRALIEAGLAVGLLPAMTAQDSIAAGRIHPVQLSGRRHPTREILAVTRASYQPAVVGRLVSNLRGELQRIIGGLPSGS